MFSNKKKMAFYAAAIFFVALDRFLKFLAVNYYSNNSVELVNNFFKFEFTPNYDIAFSIPLSGNLLTALIVPLILALVYCFIYLIKRGEEKNSFYLFFVILGAMSNLSDRLKFGYVIDYFDLKYFTVFNLADCLIVFGALGIIWKLFRQKNRFEIKPIYF